MGLSGGRPGSGRYVDRQRNRGQGFEPDLGVNLWNISGVIHTRQSGEAEEDRRIVISARASYSSRPWTACLPSFSVRLAAFRLIEASLEHKPPIESGFNST